MTSAAVVVVGSVNRDYVCRMDHLPVPGETVLGQDVVVGSGGKGGNQAVAAALWGADCALVAAVGDDSDGTLLLDDLEAAGVGTDHVQVLEGVSSGAAFVLVDAAGENTIVVAPGANARLQATRTSTVLQQLLGPDTVVVTQAEVVDEVTETAVLVAADHGSRVVLNLAPFRPVPRDVLALTDPLVVNETEAGQLLATAVDTPAAARAAADSLAERTRSCVITLGAAGAVWAGGGVRGHVPAEPCAVVDSTGAGDAFTGVLAASLAAGLELEAAVRAGVLAGTYSVQRLGAQGSFPRRGDVSPFGAHAH